VTRWGERAVSDDSLAAYFPKPREERTDIALCLSGGGFRSAAFHSGALRRLNELGILSQVTVISGVSGGSIVGAHLAERIRTWPAPGEVLPDWEGQVAAPLRAILGKNVRTGPVFRRLLPWNWDDPSTGVRALARRYQKELTGMRLGDLPEHPKYMFCSTDMVTGKYWIFQREGVGLLGAHRKRRPDWPLGRAVAASSCFPPIFSPLAVSAALGNGEEREPLVRGSKDARHGSHLTDGGTFDNNGVEAVWEDARVILVSDGGGTFDTRWRDFWLWRLRRYPAITDSRTRVLQKRWLFASARAHVLDTAIWGLAEPEWWRHDEELVTSYPEDLILDVISQVRTDLDAFSDAECKVLENHGYFMAEAAIRVLLPDIVRHDSLESAPHPEWMDPDRVRNALADSSERRILGRPHRKLPSLDSAMG
jgi:NTE family protein